MHIVNWAVVSYIAFGFFLGVLSKGLADRVFPSRSRRGARREDHPRG